MLLAVIALAVVAAGSLSALTFQLWRAPRLARDAALEPDNAAATALDASPRPAGAYAETRRLITEEHKIASERGVKGAPTLVIAGKWMLSGLRDVSEYREQILACMHKVERARFASSERVVH